MTEDGGQKTDDRGRRTEDRRPNKGMARMNGWVDEKKSWPRFRSTFDIIEAVEKGLLPDKIMINTHPQRWTDNLVEWAKELVWQNCKNLVKRGMIRFAKDGFLRNQG